MFRLELRGITKRYPGITANDAVDLAVLPGQIHAVLGENGAGKSTLMKLIYGAIQPDAGELYWNGKRVQPAHPRAARELGIAMVFQHFSLFESLTVAENVWLGLDGKQPLRAVAERIASVADEYGLAIDPSRPVHGLSVGERQRVEILRALLGSPQLLILDEPTSVLAPNAVERLFRTLRQLAAGGCSLLYISHKLDEIRTLCDTCTVLRAGRVTGVVDPQKETNASLSRLMIGAEPPALERQPRAAGPIALQVHELALPAAEEFGVALEQLSLDVHAGEIVGIVGVSGNGQKELLAALSGEDARVGPGRLRLLDEDLAGASPEQRRALGLHFVPEERLGRAAVPSLSLADNTLLTRREPIAKGWLRRGVLAQLTRRLIAGYAVQARGPDAPARSLSGGNLQKFILGREIDAAPRLLIVAQPTWGVDVGASVQIHRELLRLRDAGCAILIASEELEELFAISDTLVVMAQGRLSPRIARQEATVDEIGAWMSGLWPSSGGPALA